MNASENQDPDAKTQTNHHGILVIGASGGIGTALVRKLSAQGKRLLLFGRREAALAKIAEETEQSFLVGDATDWKAVDQACKQVVETCGGLSGAVNLAGSILLKPAHLTSEQDLRDCIDTNLVTAFGMVRSAAPLMRKSNGGSIVLLSTAATGIGLPNHEAIAAAKGGVEGLALAASATYAAYNIRVNTVAPGLVETPLSEKIWGNERAADASRGMHPLGRFGHPEEIASTIAWLLAEDQAWITGQRIAIDGGLSTIKLNR
jgi:NAD(P)-dependent dehydrogenase (short-subunit alcohol dehydrogenase family)